MPLESIELMNEYIEREYETNKQKSMRVVYGSLINACEEKGTIAPSYKTFPNYIKVRPKALKVEKGKEQHTITINFIWFKLWLIYGSFCFVLL